MAGLGHAALAVGHGGDAVAVFGQGEVLGRLVGPLEGVDDVGGEGDAGTAGGPLTEAASGADGHAVEGNAGGDHGGHGLINGRVAGGDEAVLEVDVPPPVVANHLDDPAVGVEAPISCDGHDTEIGLSFSSRHMRPAALRTTLWPLAKDMP